MERYTKILKKLKKEITKDKNEALIVLDDLYKLLNESLYKKRKTVKTVKKY